jgi:hypothetical protein
MCCCAPGGLLYIFTVFVEELQLKYQKFKFSFRAYRKKYLSYSHEPLQEC